MGNVGKLAAKMKALFQYPDMRRTMGMAARKKVEQEYSLDAHCTTLLKIYKELLSENYDTTRLEKGIGTGAFPESGQNAFYSMTD
jgi:hypothetical protein